MHGIACWRNGDMQQSKKSVHGAEGGGSRAVKAPVRNTPKMLACYDEMRFNAEFDENNQKLDEIFRLCDRVGIVERFEAGLTVCQKTLYRLEICYTELFSDK